MTFTLPTDLGDLYMLAQGCERSERFGEMIVCLKKIIDINPELDESQRNLLAVAYKSVLSHSRGGYRTLMAFKRPGENSEQVEALSARVEAEVAEICKDLFKLLDTKLIPAAKEAVDQVFYWKLKADYHRYHIEVLSKDAAKSIVSQARKCYDEAQSKFTDKTSIVVRLGVLLNASVFTYEVEGKKQEAFEMLQDAYVKGTSALDAIDSDAEYSEGVSILELMNENVQVWAEQLGGGKNAAGGADAMEVEDM